MGSGIWSSKALDDYTYTTRGVSLTSFATSDNLTAQDVFVEKKLNPLLNPKGVMRECCDSEEHPKTLPVILALDVTGSMGGTAVKVAQKLNDIMTKLYEDDAVPDIEFCIMGIGDIAYDSAPIQISQFESDIRIAEQLDVLYFEGGGGGNSYESYTAAWYMGVNHCKLDCWDRGEKGIIITLGDECPNPYLPLHPTRGWNTKTFYSITGDNLQADVETKDLLEVAKEKFNIYHISVDDNTSYKYHQRNYNCDEKWTELLGDNYHVATLDNISETVVNIILDNVKGSNNEVSW